jgi:MFS family permease
VFTLTTIASTAMAFARGSVTYNTIFFLQGPQGQDALTAGLQLIPFGVGVMLSTIVAGKLADKVGVRNLTTIGPIICIAGEIGLAYCGRDTNYWLVAFGLLVTGVGQGIFQAPNGLAGMMSASAKLRGVASAVRMLMTMVAQMIGIVITFSFVLNSMSQEQLLILFIYGGANLSDVAVQQCVEALRSDYWIVVAVCAIAAITSFMVGAWRPPALPVKAAAALELVKVDGQVATTDQNDSDATSASNEENKVVPENALSPRAERNAIEAEVEVETAM